METTKTHTINCMDSWAKEKGLPTYTELINALRAMCETGKPVLADLPNLSPELKAPEKQMRAGAMQVPLSQA
ncbi:hypothetical protein LA345_37955 (plasmid) [Burkholderia vietnamiensis]|nr:hypothetical protein [Burkholderia vietnamiensis]